MWAPDDVSELHARLRAGTLEETATFDGKREIPKDGASTAVDVCAMTVQGGVILYGVGEDSAGTRLEEATPIALEGARERVAQIVETSIAEPPQITLRTLEEPGEPDRGYLLVVVPPSPRAPHQIVAKGKYEGRFYGRGATGNRILTEAEVGALFARRERWEQGHELGLEREFDGWAVESAERDRGRVCQILKAVPLAGDDSLLARAAGAPGASNVATQLEHALRAGLDAYRRGRVDPHPIALVGQWRRQDADSWGSSFVANGQAELTMTVGRDGTAMLASRRVGDRTGSGRTVVFEEGLADNAAVFVATVGDLLARSAYQGPVDLGVYVRPLDGTYSFRREQSLGGSHYPSPSYERCERFMAAQLVEAPVDVARPLTDDLTTALVGEGYDPYVS